jgi:hypothetical protein
MRGRGALSRHKDWQRSCAALVTELRSGLDVVSGPAPAGLVHGHRDTCLQVALDG